MNRSWFRRAFGVCVLSSSLALSIGAATAGTLGGVAGTVTDAKTGAPIAGALVRISSGSDTVTVTTNDKGHYIAMSLQPDDYTISASKSRLRRNRRSRRETSKRIRRNNTICS